MEQATIHVLPLPRQLPRRIIWSIYTVTGLGLVVAIIIVVLLYDDRKPAQADREERLSNTPDDVAANQLLPNPLNGSSTTKKRERKQQQASRPRTLTRPGFVTLEEIVAYECHFQDVYQNTTWLEGSDAEISYLDAFGQRRAMNVLLEQQSNTLGADERRIVKRNVSTHDNFEMWHVERHYTKYSRSSLTMTSRYPAYICPANSHRNSHNRKLHREYGIFVPPWHLPDELSTTPRVRRRRVDLHHHATSISKANRLWLASSRRQSRAAEWKEPVDVSSLLQKRNRYDKVHVTKMILEAGARRLFVATPISNVSLRFVYGGEPPRCITCPEGDAAALECLSSDAVLSRNARFYILYCRGPDVPWTAVVSMQYPNRIIHRLTNQEYARELYASRARPLTREFEVRLDDKHDARVRLHLPLDWQDKTSRGDHQCSVERPRLLLRIADEQDAQMVDARFDCSLTTYLTTVKGYAVVYADVRASQFQSYEFRHLRFRRRELMQMSDYAKVVAHVAAQFECIDDQVIGVFGENYGGHVALNLAADNDGDDKFRCCVAVNPVAHWHDYVYPFTLEHSSGVTGALRKKMFKRHYMTRLIGRLRGKNFALHTSQRHRYYTSILLKMLNRHGVKFEHRHYEDESVKMCNSRLESYVQASDFFDRCFGRVIDA